MSAVSAAAVPVAAVPEPAISAAVPDVAAVADATVAAPAVAAVTVPHDRRRLPRPTVPRTSARRLAVLALLVPALAGLAACGSDGTPSPTASPSSAAPTTAASPSPDPTATATPAPTATPTPTPEPTPPAADALWEAVAGGVEELGHVRVRVIGPNPGVLRYQSDASATVVDDQVVFVCVDGRAYDGQGGEFRRAPGTWACGAAALVNGFRHNGQPLDAWNDSLPGDSGVEESVALEDDGRWRWSYRGRSAIFGGEVAATVWVDPGTGRILDSLRTDPTGETRYGISYEETFPAIERP